MTYVKKVALCALLQVSPRMVEVWRREKSLPFVKIGDNVRYDLEQVQEWVKHYQQNAVEGKEVL